MRFDICITSNKLVETSGFQNTCLFGWGTPHVCVCVWFCSYTRFTAQSLNESQKTASPETALLSFSGFPFSGVLRLNWCRMRAKKRNIVSLLRYCPMHFCIRAEEAEPQTVNHHQQLHNQHHHQSFHCYQAHVSTIRFAALLYSDREAEWDLIWVWSTRVDMVCFWPSDEELTLEMSAHQTSQAENIPFQPLLIKPTSYSPKQYKQCFQSLAFQWKRHRLSSL